MIKNCHFKIDDIFFVLTFQFDAIIEKPAEEENGKLLKNLLNLFFNFCI